MLVVPDIHGRPFWRAAKDYEGDIIFLGDYSDPYGHEFPLFASLRKWGSAEGVINNMLEVFDFARQNPDRVTVLVGNHCYHYITDVQKCSRYDEEYGEEIAKAYQDNLDILRIAKVVGNTLFTHAGVLREWLDLRMPEAKTPQEIAQRLNEMLTEKSKELYDVGATRGGREKVSGPLWADIRDIEYNKYLNPEPAHYFAECAQVFGHTQMREDGHIWKTDEYPVACLDSRRMFEIDPDLEPKEVIKSIKVWGEPVNWKEILGKPTEEEKEEFNLDDEGNSKSSYW